MEFIKIFHDSQDLKYRTPYGAVELMTNVKLSIYVSIDAKVTLVYKDFEGNQNSIEMKKTNEVNMYYAELQATDKVGLINYYFKIEGENKTVYYGNNYDCLGGIGEIYKNNPNEYQITVFKKADVPKWYKEGVIYQIFVDRFFNGNDDGRITNPRSNIFIYGNWNDDPLYIKDKNGKIARWDFFGGNIKGVIKKLDYIKSLGATIIYLNPIFESPSSHKYDTADYEKVDQMFGTNEDFINLCSEAEKRGIKVILDGVFSHTGDDSKYFNKYGHYKELGAYQSKDSKYYEWYRFYNYPDSYECWWNISNQPNVEELTQSYIDYIIESNDSIINKWLNYGASGWRLDVADELPDEFIVKIKKRMKEIKKQSVLIGEVWEDASNKVSYNERRRYFLGDELDSVTNYPLRDNIISFLNRKYGSSFFIKRIMSLRENYPIENFNAGMNLLGNHDTERILTILHDEVNLLKFAIVLQMTLPGVPLIYYGDEAGLTGGKDPENRKTYPWNKENKIILNMYKRLCNIRNNEEALKRGNLKFHITDEDVLCFEREIDNQLNIISLNRSNDYKVFCLYGVKGIFDEVFEDKGRYSSKNSFFNIELKPNEVKIFRKINS